MGQNLPVLIVMSFGKSLPIFFVGLVIFIALPAEIRAQTAEIDIPRLLREAAAQSDANWRKMLLSTPNYTYKFRKIWRETGKDGRIAEKSEVYEIFPPPKCRGKKCRNVTVMLEKNGRAISVDKIEKQRRQAGEQLEKLENDEKAKPLPSNQNLNWLRFSYFDRDPFADEARIIVKIDGQELLQKCEFFSPEREMINGREAISLKFRPRSRAVFAKETNYVRNVEGKIWLDAEEKIFIRLAMWPTGARFENQTGAALLGRAALVYDSTRTREGIWFFHLARINGLENSTLLPEMKTDFSIEHFEHHFFETEIKNVEIERVR